MNELIDFNQILISLFDLMGIEIGEQHDSHEFLVVLQEFIQEISNESKSTLEILPQICTSSLLK
jgi:hypothetical protein